MYHILWDTLSFSLHIYITCLEARAIIIRMVAGPKVHFMLTIVMLSLSMLVSSADKMKDMQIIKREIFLQKLAAKIDQHTGYEVD